MNFDQSQIDEKINSIRSRVNNLETDVKTSWLVKAIGFIDLTSLGGDDTPTRIETLCTKVIFSFALKIFMFDISSKILTFIYFHNYRLQTLLNYQVIHTCMLHLYMYIP